MCTRLSRRTAIHSHPLPPLVSACALRPGRLDKLLYVKLPTAGERAAILRKHLRRTPLASEVDVAAIAADSRAEGFSGADVAALVREATLQALREAQQRQREEMVSKGVKPADAHSWASMKVSTSSPSIGPAASTAAEPLPVLVGTQHFHFAFSKVFPSVSQASRAKYDRMHRALCRARSTLSNENPGETIAHAAANVVEMVEEEKTEPNTNGPPTTLAPPQTNATRKSPLQHSMPPPPPKQLSALAAATSTLNAHLPPAASSATANQGTILSSMNASSAAAASNQMDTQ
jgi:hypothetical protein